MHSGLHDARVSLQEGDSYVILRFKDSKSDKYYGLLNQNGVFKSNWGRFSSGHVLPKQGQQKTCSRTELLDLLDAKVRKGYKVMEIRRNISKGVIPRPEGLEGAYMLMPRDQNNYNKVWGLYDKLNNFMMWVPTEVASGLAKDLGLVIAGLNKF